MRSPPAGNSPQRCLHNPRHAHRLCFTYDLGLLHPTCRMTCRSREPRSMSCRRVANYPRQHCDTSMGGSFDDPPQACIWIVIRKDKDQLGVATQMASGSLVSCEGDGHPPATCDSSSALSTRIVSRESRTRFVGRFGRPLETSDTTTTAFLCMTTPYTVSTLFGGIGVRQRVSYLVYRSNKFLSIIESFTSS